jgi:uncharacterized membrane protein YgcG
MRLVDLIPIKERKFIKTHLQELEFTHQRSFDAYKKTHKLRPDTKVTIAGKETTAGEASKEPGMLKKLGAKLFGKPEAPIEMPKLDPKHPLNKIVIYSDDGKTRVTIKKALENPQKYIDKKNQKRKDSAAADKEFNRKQKELQQWRKDNPELAKKQDDERRKRNRDDEDEDEDDDRDTQSRSSFSSLPSFSGGSGGGFGGFGGGSSGGAGASGNW